MVSDLNQSSKAISLNMLDKKMVDILFSNIIKRFKTWMNKTPTGKFVIEININQGGIIGKPKVTITENM